MSSSVKDSSASAVVSSTQHQPMTEADRDKAVLDAAKEAWSAAPRVSSTNGAPSGPGAIGMERKKVSHETCLLVAVISTMVLGTYSLPLC